MKLLAAEMDENVDVTGLAAIFAEDLPETNFHKDHEKTNLTGHFGTNNLHHHFGNGTSTYNDVGKTIFYHILGESKLHDTLAKDSNLTDNYNSDISNRHLCETDIHHDIGMAGEDKPKDGNVWSKIKKSLLTLYRCASSARLGEDQGELDALAAGAVAIPPDHVVIDTACLRGCAGGQVLMTSSFAMGFRR